MAVCKFCNEKMNTSISCIESIKGQIKYGDEKEKSKVDHKCYSCFVEKGGYHHVGCDEEECPVCGGQLISCGCSYKAIDKPYETFEKLL